MTLDRSWLLATAREEREAMGRTIQYTEPDRWAQPSGCAGWTNADVVAHLASSDAVAASTMAGERLEEIESYLGSLPDGSAPTVDGFNDYAVTGRAQTPVRSLISAWGRAADAFLNRCAAVPEDGWADTRVYWIAGQMRVSNLLQSRVMEWWLHGEDIRTGAELPSRRLHKPIYCVNDLAIRSIPYALSLVGLSFPGKSVELRLDGAGEGRWHRGLAPREVPPPGTRPDTVIDGRGYRFALVAGHRLAPEDAMEEGTVIVGGDIELGETILKNIRSFA
jgi:uncharacterized protein (TIGR03083 family)